MTRNEELRAFLRARRADVRPEDAGLEIEADTPRRVSGLRREELALLAGVSVDYYTRLEQGRGVRPSDHVLDSIADVLHLTAAQRDHLYTLVRARQRVAQPVHEKVSPHILGLLASLDTPAMVKGPGTAVLGHNTLFAALVSDFAARPASERYYAYWLFADPAAREVMVDWGQFARETVGVLRADAARSPEDSRIAALIEDLSRISEPFRRLWAEHDVQTHTSGSKRYRHPIAGEITVLHQAARLEQEQWLYLYWVERGSDSELAMQRLRTAAAT